MVERIDGRKSEKGRGVRDWLMILDSGLLWPRPARQLPAGPAVRFDLDLELANFHARYERACIED